MSRAGGRRATVARTSKQAPPARARVRAAGRRWTQLCASSAPRVRGGWGIPACACVWWGGGSKGGRLGSHPPTLHHCAAYTGEVGDGKIFVQPVADVIRMCASCALRGVWSCAAARPPSCPCTSGLYEMWARPPPPLAPQPHRRDGRAGRAHGGRHAGHDRQACGVKRAAWGAPCTHREMPRCPLRARRHRCGVIVWLEVIGAAAACDAPARCAPRTSGVSGCKLPCHLPHTLDAHRTAL